MRERDSVQVQTQWQALQSHSSIAWVYSGNSYESQIAEVLAAALAVCRLSSTTRTCFFRNNLPSTVRIQPNQPTMCTVACPYPTIPTTARRNHFPGGGLHYPLGSGVESSRLRGAYTPDFAEYLLVTSRRYTVRRSGMCTSS